MNILLIGLGGFGRNHLDAWIKLGYKESLYVAELNENMFELCYKYGIKKERISTNYTDFLAEADIVDVVTPTDSHYDLCSSAIELDKDVFVEKPMTMNAEEALSLHKLVREKEKILQIGYYYRFHPICQFVKDAVSSGSIGDVRYISGEFLGFKRARTDVGVTQTDAIHFIDLFNWFLDDVPVEIYAATKDHWNRDMENLSIVLMDYPNDILVKIESGYIQPGAYNDMVVESALTTKEFYVVGTDKTIEVNLELGSVKVYDVHHELQNGVWTMINNGYQSPKIKSLNTVEQVSLELKSFVSCVKSRDIPAINSKDSGVIPAYIIEAIHKSSRERKPVKLNLHEVT